MSFQWHVCAARISRTDSMSSAAPSILIVDNWKALCTFSDRDDPRHSMPFPDAAHRRRRCTDPVHPFRYRLTRSSHMNDLARTLPLTEGFFSVKDQIQPERLAAVEGVKPKGVVEVRRLMVGNDILMLHVFREKGLIDP